jgi:hypothetical protein
LVNRETRDPRIDLQDKAVSWSEVTTNSLDSFFRGIKDARRAKDVDAPSKYGRAFLKRSRNALRTLGPVSKPYSYEHRH